MYSPWMYDPWLLRFSPRQLKKYLQCEQVAVHRLLWHCMYDPWALFDCFSVKANVNGECTCWSLQLSPLQLQKELAVHGATLPYQLNLCPAILVTFSTIVAYQKSQRNTRKGLQVTVRECANRRRYVYSANSTSADPWRYAAISIECVTCNCGDLFSDRGISIKPEEHA